MIKANELRIGNLILFSESHTVFTVVGIYGTGFDVSNEEENTWIESETFEGIPLTEKILLATGFKQGPVEGFYYLDVENKTFLVSGGDSVWIEKEHKEDEVSVGIGGAENVHQLQNLYFALCNKELDVKFETT